MKHILGKLAPAGLVLFALACANCANTDSESSQSSEKASSTSTSINSTDSPADPNDADPNGTGSNSSDQIPQTNPDNSPFSTTAAPKLADLTSLDPKLRAQLTELDIDHLLAEFTTYYDPGKPRVINIQRIADLTRGAIIMPNEILSLNNHIGERTLEKGFAAAGVIDISRGIFGEVGSGISQFATTLFNAAFFAGLDIPEYRAHTYHFDRYPYGREATINWDPPIDLKIKNNTQNAILIWTSYTEGSDASATSNASTTTKASITVAVYGIPYFIEIKEVLPKIITPHLQNCERVETHRSRTRPDGAQILDSFFAIYGPALGALC